jgi:hypothetical protein
MMKMARAVHDNGTLYRLDSSLIAWWLSEKRVVREA